MVHNANAEIKSLQARVSGECFVYGCNSLVVDYSNICLSDMQKTQAQLEEKNNELFQMYHEKSKKHAQITNLYNLLKSRTMKSQMQTAASQSVSQVLNSLAPPTSAPPIITQVPQTPSQGLPVTKDGIELLHRYQRSGTGSSSGRKGHDRTAMPPPSRPTRITKPTTTSQHRTRFPGPARPSSRLANLPHDNALFQRFHAPPVSNEAPDIAYFTDHRNGFVEANAPRQSPRTRLGYESYFDSPRR